MGDYCKMTAFSQLNTSYTKLKYGMGDDYDREGDRNRKVQLFNTCEYVEEDIVKTNDGDSYFVTYTNNAPAKDINNTASSMLSTDKSVATVTSVTLLVTKRPYIQRYKSVLCSYSFMLLWILLSIIVNITITYWVNTQTETKTRTE